MAKFLRN